MQNEPFFCIFSACAVGLAEHTGAHSATLYLAVQETSIGPVACINFRTLKTL